ncbi:MAG: helix-turn-helix transcriptional regulator, partial [Candidatus Acidiferrum sp.]
GKARIVISKSNLKAARSALKVLWYEYAQVDLTLRQFWNAMELEIEGISNSYQLTGIQRRLLQIEFHAPPEPRNPTTTHAPAAPIALNKPEPIAKQIDRLREESRLTVEEVAEALDVDPRSVYRHLSGQANPRSRQIAAYEELCSDLTGIFCTRGNERKSGTKELEHGWEEAHGGADRSNVAAD